MYDNLLPNIPFVSFVIGQCDDRGTKLRVKTLTTADTEKLRCWNLDTHIMSTTRICAHINTKFCHHSPVLLISILETYTALVDVHMSPGALKFRQWQIWWYFLFAKIVTDSLLPTGTTVMYFLCHFHFYWCNERETISLKRCPKHSKGIFNFNMLHNGYHI